MVVSNDAVGSTEIKKKHVYTYMNIFGPYSGDALLVPARCAYSVV